MHSLWRHNQVSQSFFSLSVCLSSPPLLLHVSSFYPWWSPNVTDFYQPNPQRRHMQQVGALHTIYDLYHDWISKVSFSGKCQLSLEFIYFLSAERTAGWRLSIRSNSGVGGSLRWCSICCSHTEFKTALNPKWPIQTQNILIPGGSTSAFTLTYIYSRWIY